MMVTLSAATAISSTFAGWSGLSCPGTETCQVTKDAAKSVMTTFTQCEYTLNITTVGNGSVVKSPD